MVRWSSLTCWLSGRNALCGVIVVLLMLIGLAHAQSSSVSPASPPLKVILDENYPPYVFRQDDGKLVGYLVDLWQRWEAHTGRPVELNATSWGLAQVMMEQGRFDVLDTVFRTPEREQIYRFSAPYADLAVNIYAHREIGGITDLDTLRGFLVGVKVRDACVEYLLDAGINSIAGYSSYEKLIQAAATDSVKVFCLDAPPAQYLLYKAGLNNRFYPAFTLYTGRFHRAVRKGDEALLAEIEAGFAAIRADEYRELHDKWLGGNTVDELRPWLRLLSYALLSLLLLGVLFAVWNFSLRALVLRRTQELNVERARLTSFFDVLPDIVWMKDGQGVYQRCNAALERFMGLPATQIIGFDDAAMHPAEVAQALRRDDLRAAASGQPLITEETLFSPGHGREIMLETIKSPVRDENGELLGVIGVARDISARRAHEEAIRLASCVFESTAEGIMINDTEGRVIALNSALTRITGFTAEDLIGKLPEEMSAGRHAPGFYDEIRAELSLRDRWQGEIWILNRKRQLCPTWQSIGTLRDEQGLITHYVVAISDISELKRSQAAADFLANYDALTNLPNRLLFTDRLQQALARAECAGKQVGVMYLDLDRFKFINDSLGHSMGDEILRETSRRLNTVIGSSDTLARLGGDEFALLIESKVSARMLALLADELGAVLTPPIEIGEHVFHLSASIGISVYPEDGRSVDSLLSNADVAMFKAKEQGRNNYQFYEQGMAGGVQDRLLLESALRAAIANGELQVHYQPQIHLTSQRLAGVEALLRWHNPRLGWVAPARFIPVAEEMGFINELGSWVLKQVCAQLSAWQQAGLQLPRVAVNLSMQQLEKGDLVGAVGKLLDRYRLSPEMLELEVTESVLMQRTDEVLKTLDGLHQLGVLLAIDDFGTGYSSLAYLRQLPVQRLKIDRSFVIEIGQSGSGEAIVRAIIGLGDSLGMEVVAEGVELEAQAAFLKQANCAIAQGYLYARPEPAAQIEAQWLHPAAAPSGA